MRFYQQPHRFYCGVDLHTRLNRAATVEAPWRTRSYLTPLPDGRGSEAEPVILHPGSGRRCGTAEFLGRDEEPAITP